MTNRNRKPYVYKRLEPNADLLAAFLTEWKANHRDAFYDIDTTREQEFAFQNTRAYHLRTAKRPWNFNHVNCSNTPLLSTFPSVVPLITDIGSIFGGWAKVGRIFVSKLMASSSIIKHTDTGHYFDLLHRVHIALSGHGSAFHWDDQSLVMNTGEVWLLNNSIPHYVESSDVDRVNLIFDAVEVTRTEVE